MSAPSSDALTARFQAAGYDLKQAEIAAKSKYAKAFDQLLTEAGNPTDKSVSLLLYTLASKYPNGISSTARAALVNGIASRGLKSDKQLDAALKYVKRPENDVEGKWDQKKFESTAGVGVVVTKEQIAETVRNLIEKERAALAEQRYRHAPKLMATLNASLPWAEGAALKSELDAQALALLGPKTEEDMKKVKAAPKTDAKSAAAAAAASASPSPSPDAPPPEIDWLELLNGRELVEARNTPEILAEHKKITGGKPITRFPPEPNGYLHIGHAKSMHFNFGLANKFGGQCIMRFDDTNPEAERGEYIEAIKDNLAWLGHKPSRITHSSEYFPQLYDLAVKLIKKGKAYVCHQTAEEIKKSRETKIPSPWRERPIEESLKLFEDMRKGKFEEGKAILRMKGDMNAANPQMWDLVAYRIKYAPHPHVGNEWCIYPSYDYTHCIVDSLENITHSCCTLEFEVRRESYYWLLHELDLYKPKVWEFSRLNLEHTVMSKRRLLRLVMEKHVNGWDDPRLPTLNGYRRRGYPAAAIELFCETIGISRNENFISPLLLEHCARTTLEPLARRAMVIKDPVPVYLSNWPQDKVEILSAPNFPKDESKGTHEITWSSKLFIDASDVSAEDRGKDFFGLSPGKEVHLKYAYNIKCERVETHGDGSIKAVHATVDTSNKTKCKGKITWVAAEANKEKPLEVELRLYDLLFKSKDPMEYGGDEWLKDLNPESLVVKMGYADKSLANAKPGDYFQFEREAFFVCDLDSTKDKLVFNRTVNLKEGGKAAGKAKPNKK